MPNCHGRGPLLAVFPADLLPGRTWPPYPLGGIPGITAVSTDRATVEITNRTGRTYYYRVSGWELDQFETCRGGGSPSRESRRR